jgi:hypothetical protein
MDRKPLVDLHPALDATYMSRLGIMGLTVPTTLS